jgi:hypothetical protein
MRRADHQHEANKAYEYGRYGPMQCSELCGIEGAAQAREQTFRRSWRLAAQYFDFQLGQFVSLSLFVSVAV